MLQNSRVTAFTVFELWKENQLGVKLPLLPPRLGLKIVNTWNTLKNIKKIYKNNKFKISAPAWKDKFELCDGSYSVSDIQNYFEYIFKNIKHWLIIQPQQYIQQKWKLHLKLNQDIIFYFLASLTMKLFGSTESKISKNKNGEPVPYLETYNSYR